MNSENRFVKLVTLHDPAQAEVLRGMLEAQGMQVLLTKEAAAQVYGTFVGSMSEIELYVAAEHEQAAKALVDEVIGK
ncbi:MAG: DUF2007 domain-containing protein [Anaerolineales bacterium]|nr:MAG: DUF2007 domain-containing protein [Anaerolineales bacterium]